MPIVIRELDDDQAVVAMVDSNLHRENLKPSEKAFAYRMKLDAMKHQGKRYRQKILLWLRLNRGLPKRSREMLFPEPCGVMNCLQNR